MKRVESSRPGKIGVALACTVAMVFVCGTFAEPLYVSLNSAQYMTYVEVFQATNDLDDTGITVSRTTTSAGPLSDEIDLPVIAGQGEGMGIITHAMANAGSFAVSDQTGWGFANAEAVSQVWFSPIADQTQAVNFSISAFGPTGSRSFTAGQIILLDFTSNSEIWNYSWNEGGSAFTPVPVPSDDDIPWNLDGDTSDFSLDTDFLVSHQYELTMIVCSNAGDDSETAQVQLSGLQAVPEPSPLVLLAVGGSALALLRRYNRF